MVNKDSKIWDVVVVGGGPAGMMAAGAAAAKGLRVVLLEKNPTLGKKLLITGGGRCNVTNAETDTRKLLAKFGDAEQFLFSAFAQWGTKDTLDFFHTRGMPTKVENELRVFPVSNRAQSVWDTLVAYMREGKVTILTNSPVASFLTTKDKSIKAVKLKGSKIIEGKHFILATGGKSHPETGSTGDGFGWLKTLGHTVIDTAPALVPLKLKAPWLRELQGITLSMVRFTILQDDVRPSFAKASAGKQSSHRGKLLFTHFGVSGPGVLNMSNEVRERLQYGTVTIMADLIPDKDHKQVDTMLLELLKGDINKKFKNIVTRALPNAIIQTLGTIAGIDPETPCHSIPREKRLAFVQLLKAFPLHVTGTLGLEKAVITSGGIDLKEVDFKTMRSCVVPNLSVTGDILNISRPTGGYGLQLCWTTGYVAGRHALEK